MFNSARNSYLQEKRIFTVEDDVLNLGVLYQILSSSGAMVFENYSNIGIVAHIIENLPIDIILLDLMLRKGVSGYDIVQKIKGNPETAHIPVVAVSSMDAEVAIPKAKELGFDGFISKPIDSTTFSKDIAAILDGEEIWKVSR